LSFSITYLLSNVSCTFVVYFIYKEIDDTLRFLKSRLNILFIQGLGGSNPLFSTD